MKFKSQYMLWVFFTLVSFRYASQAQASPVGAMARATREATQEIVEQGFQGHAAKHVARRAATRDCILSESHVRRLVISTLSTVSRMLEQVVFKEGTTIAKDNLIITFVTKTFKGKEEEVMEITKILPYYVGKKREMAMRLVVNLTEKTVFSIYPYRLRNRSMFALAGIPALIEQSPNTYREVVQIELQPSPADSWSTFFVEILAEMPMPLGMEIASTDPTEDERMRIENAMWEKFNEAYTTWSDEHQISLQPEDLADLWDAYYQNAIFMNVLI
jgi:hypothetical protein